jgi:formylglycine-generating enzyme required for sulfatase activity
MQNINDGTNPNKPATGVSWIEAAKFVNQLNTSKGFQAAYNFNSNGQLTTWGASEAWQPSSSSDPDNGDRTNFMRHKNAAFWIPSVDEWYKSAYYDPNKDGVGGYRNYATGSDNLPTPVEQGTDPGTAVFEHGYLIGPAVIDKAGGLSPLGTMAQNGNVWEWTETEVDLVNDSANGNRITRGGSWYLNAAGMSRIERYGEMPDYEAGNAGFRIAANFSAVPEPASFSLVSACAGLAFAGRYLKRRLKSNNSKVEAS